MKVLVTGASGHLGHFVIRELEQAGHDLVLMSRSRPKAADRWPWVEGSITSFDACLRATAGAPAASRARAGEGGVEAIQHVAARL